VSFFDWVRSAFGPRETAAPKVSAPVVRHQYQAAKSSYLTQGFGQMSGGSADTSIRSSLSALRARSRQLVRDSAYAKRAQTIVVNNVIGSGIGLQAQVQSSRGSLHDRANEGIEAAFCRWSAAEYCHTGGALHFSDFERALMAEVFEAGEVFVRMHMTPFGGSDIPFALELIESERVPHEFQSVASVQESRMGVEVDQFYRPVAYWIRDRHPSDVYPGGMQNENIRRVPASEIIHLRLVERWPQTRGVPWLHAVARKLNDMDGYSEAEITAARAAAMYLGWEESPEILDPTIERQEDGSYETTLEPNTILRPKPGNKLNFYAPNRPNSALDAFMRYMLREVASGTGYGISYASLSGDYSQSNYSSSRLSLLDDRDSWRALQQWFIRTVRTRVHQMWLQQAVFAGAVEGVSVSEYMANREKFEAVRFRPRGWGWVDPTKEVQAFKDAVRAGFMTLQDVVSTSGADLEELIDQRKKEVAMTEAAGLVLDTDPKQVSNAGLTQARPGGTTRPDDDTPDEPEEQQRMRVVK
jgi:lambda family phage portal protein